MDRNIVVSMFLFCLVGASLHAAEPQDSPAPKDWPDVMNTVRYHSPVDDSYQPAVFYAPKSDEPIPLLVSLHTWSSRYTNTAKSRADWCINNGWAMIHPDFRGPNNTPQACGSELAVADIVAAVEFAKKRTKIDTDRIYLLGASGGGYGAMLFAGRHPEIWAGVSAWCGITDLTDWYHETSVRKMKYATDIEKSCGGVPGTSPEVDKQYRDRSSNTWVKNAADIPLDINHGIHDGYTGSVPVSHALRAFNKLAEPGKKLTDEQIRFFREKQSVPDELKAEAVVDPLYGTKEVLFRRLSGATRLTVFEGGHDSVEGAALDWLARQKKGQKPDWNVRKPSSAQSKPQSEEIGK